MEYKLSLGSWNSVFAVPSDIVDKHLKLAGAAQLKVILWFLRHAGEGFTVDDIAAALSMQVADVRDCMLYWTETGIINFNEGHITPSEQKEENIIEEKPQAEQNVCSENSETQPIQKQETKEPEKPKKSSRALSRPEKPDIKYLSQRISADPGITYLMQTADEIFGRPTNNNDKATLLMIHETDGLPIEVIIMLMQYAAGLGKCNIRYIEKMAISWADEQIMTLELAEKKIQKLTSGRSAAATVQKLLGLDEHSPTEKETEYADRWMNMWKFSPELIRKAYEICVDAKGKYIPKYVDSVLNRWHNSGIATVEQADADQNKGKNKQKPKNTTTYDIGEYESTNAIFEEGY